MSDQAFHALHPAFPLDHTHDPQLASWVEAANDPAGDFPVQNLPLGLARLERAGHVVDQLVTAIGDQVVILDELFRAGLLPELQAAVQEVGGSLAFSDATVLLQSGADLARALRLRLSRLLRRGADASAVAKTREAMAPLAGVEMLKPVYTVPNYTDFYASIDHAATVGSMFRPDSPLLPNYKHVPIGYHGRASSIVASGTPVTRPRGQQAPPDADPGAGPTFGPCKMLDYELEVGLIVGAGNELGQPIGIGEAHRHIVGVCLLNDWSARDLQRWEYQPLGPFLAKNFATSISPWIVTLEALAPFRSPARPRPDGDPRPLPYLTDAADQSAGNFDVALEVYLSSAQMRARGMSPLRLSSGTMRWMYWTPAQLLAHHASNGCNLQPGDILATGTISGAAADARGCLLELTWDGLDPATGKPKPRRPIQLPTGETRTFLADGDEVMMRGFCQRPGARRIGLGECRGVIQPSMP